MTTDPLAQAAMVAYCGWDPTVVLTDETVYLDGDGSTLLQLPSLYVTAVSAVTLTDGLGNIYTATIDQPGTVGGNDVGWTDNGLLTWHPWTCSPYAVWPIGEQNIAVTYSGGYAQPPDDLMAALDKLSSRMPNITGAVRKQLGSASITYSSQSAGRQGSSTIAEGGFLLVEQMVFDRYRIPRVR